MSENSKEVPKDMVEGIRDAVNNAKDQFNNNNNNVTSQDARALGKIRDDIEGDSKNN